MNAENSSSYATDTLTRERKPVKRHEQLEPWLDLANEYSAGRRDTVDDGLTQFVLSTLALILILDGRFPIDTSSIEGELPRFRTGELELKDFSAKGASVELEISNGLLEARVNHRHLEFLEALRGAEVARIQRCPQCQKYFYAKRVKSAKYKSYATGCSRNCSAALRMQRLRAKWSGYHQNRKIRENEKAKRREVRRGKNNG
jgi:hypothetical protein